MLLAVKALRRKDLERDGIECVVLELNKVLLQLHSFLLEIKELSCVLVYGDFNLSELDWSFDCCAPINKGSSTSSYPEKVHCAKAIQKEQNHRALAKTV